MERAYARAMGARSSRRLAWTLGTVSVGLVAVAAGFDVVNAADDRADPWLPSIAAAAVGFGAVGGLVAARQRRNPIGWMLLAIGVGHAISGASIGYGTWAASTGRAGAGAALWLGNWAWLPLAGLPAVLLLFPSGRLRSRRLRPVLLVALALPLLLMAGVAVHPQRLLDDPAVENPFGIGVLAGALDAAAPVALLLLAVALVVAVAAMVARARRAGGDERAQLEWALLGGAALALQLPFEAFASARVTGLVSAVLIGVFCSSLGIAMLRHRLYDIELVLNRTLVYGALTGCVVAVYAGAVALLGALFETRANAGLSLVATGIVAVLFSPLRLWLQRGVDRLFYGRRDDPYAVVTQLARRLVEAAPERILPALVEEVAAALRLPRVAIELRGGGVATYGRGGGEPLVLALAFHGQDVGRLELARRAPGEEFTGAELRLFEGLARQIGVAAYAVALTGDLQRSRERLVTAREEERRRLRRDLHDGLGPLLAGISLKLGAARNLLPGDPDAAEALLSQLADEAQAAVGDVRRVVDDLRPPALDQLGLVPAIRQQATRFDGSLAVTVEASGDLADLPAAVEVAAFRIATEALTNVARHAGATSCRVAIARDGGLEVEVRDDGRGLPAQIVPGVGLSSIRERTAELGGACTIARDPGGGTVVRARLPVARS